MYNVFQQTLGFIFVSIFIFGCANKSMEIKPNNLEKQKKLSRKNTEIKSNSKPNTKMSDLNQKEEIPILQSNITFEQNKLSVSYKVKNNTKTSIYLFNIIWDMDNTGKYILSPQPLYTSVGKENSLHFAKQILPVPTGKKIEMRIIPFVTKVEANEEFSENIDVDIPIEEYNPYFPKSEDSEYEIRKSESAIFTIQFIRESDEMKLNKTPMPNTHSVWHPDLFGNVESLTSKPSPIEVQINKRLDDFESF